MAGGTGGGEACEIVRADTGDLTAFVDAGAGHVSSLRAVFDGISAARSRAIGALAIGDIPAARAARLDGGWDPLGEQIAEAGLANLFVAEIRDALSRDGAAGPVGWVPAEVVDRALAAAGLAGLGPDRSMADDIDRVAEAQVRRELLDVLAPLDDEDLADHHRVAIVGLALEEWLADQDGSDPERAEAVARVLIDLGVERRAAMAGDGVSGPEGVDGAEGAVSGMLVTQGILAWPGDRGELVDSLHSTTVVSASSGEPVTALSVALDALDLNQTVDELNIYGVGAAEWRRANQPWVRNAALMYLIDASIDGDGLITPGGQALVDDVLDRYPTVVELAGDAWHDTDFGHGLHDRYQSTPDGHACRIWPTETVRTALARGLAAPNNGLSVDDHRAARSLDDLDAQLIEVAGTDPGAANDLWNHRQALINELVDGDPDQAQLLDRAMTQGLSASEALRLIRNAEDPTRTNDRVRRLRVLYPTTAWGDPVAPDNLDPGGDPGGPDQGLPLDVARSLAGELGVLQTVQLARHAEGRPVPESPLTDDQVDLVRRYDDVARWFHHRFAGAFPGGAEAAADYLTEYDGDLSDLLHDAPDGLADLLTELADPDNQIIWDLMAGAAGNDTFLGPEGTYQPAGEAYVVPADARALLVQLGLQTEIGPYQADLDTNGDGTIHEDEVADWLAMAEADGSIPPALVDRIRLGTSHGIGQDTFGWEEIGELVGWVGLTAAVTATIVYSGGTATPVWVKAGLFGLAGLEAFAYSQADDPGTATLAIIVGLPDLAAARRLLQVADAVPTGAVDDILQAQQRHRDLVEAARRSEIPGLPALADRADDLSPAEFLSEFESILDRTQADLVQRMIADGATPAQAADALRAAGIEPLEEAGVARWTVEEQAEIAQSRPWQSFDRNLDDQFFQALDDFGGDPHPPRQLRGGEGQLFLSDQHPNLALKRWHEARSGDFDESVQALVDARVAVSSDPELATFVDVVEVHERGPDWIVRDYHPNSYPLRKAIEESHEAREALAATINALEGTTDPTLQTLLRRLDRQGGPSANIHWSTETGRLIIIDMM